MAPGVAVEQSLGPAKMLPMAVSWAPAAAPTSMQMPPREVRAAAERRPAPCFLPALAAVPRSIFVTSVLAPLGSTTTPALLFERR
jgi:hypothetical protein